MNVEAIMLAGEMSVTNVPNEIRVCINGCDVTGQMKRDGRTLRYAVPAATKFLNGH